MSKSITITDKETSYTLEFNRDTVRRMEQSGFNINEAYDKPMTNIPMLFSGALMLHHPMVSSHVKEELWKKIPDKQGFITALVALYNEPLDTLVEEPDKKSGEVSWKINQ